MTLEISEGIVKPSTCRSEIGYSRKEVVPQLAGEVSRHRRSHSVGGDVAYPGEKRAEYQQAAPDYDGRDLSEGDKVVDDMREYPRDSELYKRSENFDEKSERHSRNERLEVCKQSFHLCSFQNL